MSRTLYWKDSGTPRDPSVIGASGYWYTDGTYATKATGSAPGTIGDTLDFTNGGAHYALWALSANFTIAGTRLQSGYITVTGNGHTFTMDSSSTHCQIGTSVYFATGTSGITYNLSGDCDSGAGFVVTDTHNQATVSLSNWTVQSGASNSIVAANGITVSAPLSGCAPGFALVCNTSGGRRGSR